MATEMPRATLRFSPEEDDVDEEAPVSYTHLDVYKRQAERDRGVTLGKPRVISNI